MKGRAGRKGLDEVGESILICKKEDFQRCLELMKKEPLSVESCLFYHQIGLARAILEAISTGVLQKKDQIPIYISNTLLAYHPLFQTDQAEQRLAEAINFLKENNFLLIETDETLVPTVLSHATLASSLSPDDALLVASELNRDMNSFCIRDDFHIIYHTTPINFNYIQHDWQRIFDKVNSMLQTSGKKIVADLIGIQPFYLQKIAMGASLSRIDSKFLIHQRYANALILFDLTIDGLTFQGHSYIITKINLKQKFCIADPTSFQYYTRANFTVSFESITGGEQVIKISNMAIQFGKLIKKQKHTGYSKIDPITSQVIEMGIKA